MDGGPGARASPSQLVGVRVHLGRSDIQTNAHTYEGKLSQKQPHSRCSTRLLFRKPSLSLSLTSTQPFRLINWLPLPAVGQTDEQPASIHHLSSQSDAIRHERQRMHLEPRDPVAPLWFVPLVWLATSACPIGAEAQRDVCSQPRLAQKSLSSGTVFYQWVGSS